MIEILVVVSLTKGIASRAREKGQSAGLFGTLLVAFWVLGELIGGLVGAFASAANGGEPQMIVVYAGALIGAGIGAATAYGMLGMSRDKYAASRFEPQTFEVAQDSALRVS